MFEKTLVLRPSYFVLGLPTGGTPKRMYAKLVAAHREGKVSFKVGRQGKSNGRSQKIYHVYQVGD